MRNHAAASAGVNQHGLNGRRLKVIQNIDTGNAAGVARNTLAPSERLKARIDSVKSTMFCKFAHKLTGVRVNPSDIKWEKIPLPTLDI